MNRCSRGEVWVHVCRKPTQPTGADSLCAVGSLSWQHPPVKAVGGCTGVPGGVCLSFGDSCLLAASSTCLTTRTSCLHAARRVRAVRGPGGAGKVNCDVLTTRQWRRLSFAHLHVLISWAMPKPPAQPQTLTTTSRSR